VPLLQYVIAKARVGPRACDVCLAFIYNFHGAISAVGRFISTPPEACGVGEGQRGEFIIIHTLRQRVRIKARSWLALESAQLGSGTNRKATQGQEE